MRALEDYLQTFRVDEAQRIPLHICIGVDPTLKPNRITFEVATCRRVIVSRTVVIEPGLLIPVLPRQYSDAPPP